MHSELEWLGWYLELMQLRFGGRLTIRQEIQADTLKLAVPRLILQPLVENALRHGAAKRAGPAEVMITAGRGPLSGRPARLADSESWMKGVGLEHEPNGQALTGTATAVRTTGPRVDLADQLRVL